MNYDYLFKIIYNMQTYFYNLKMKRNNEYQMLINHGVYIIIM